jgi:hypothetical protein
MNRKLGGPQRCYESFGKEIKLAATEPVFICNLAVGLATTQVKLFSLTNAHIHTYTMIEYVF